MSKQIQNDFDAGLSPRDIFERQQARKRLKLAEAAALVASTLMRLAKQNDDDRIIPNSSTMVHNSMLRALAERLQDALAA